MDALVLALFILENQYHHPAGTVPEPEFQPFNLAALRLPTETADTIRGATPLSRNDWLTETRPLPVR